MTAEAPRQGEQITGGRWEFSPRNTNIAPTNETFVVTQILRPHLNLLDAIADNYLESRQWKPQPIIQRSPWGEEEFPSLFFVFENSLKTALTTERPNFLTVLRKDYEDDVFGADRRAGLPVVDSVKKALAGTNLSCLYIAIEFNEIKRKKGLLRKGNDYQNGVVFFQLGFTPVDQVVGELQEKALDLLERSKSLASEAEGLLLSKVSKPVSLFVDPPPPTPIEV